jgi:D-arabinose 1-dehydrogenase-like Zn-dependent alcohol dehydrogenase
MPFILRGVSLLGIDSVNAEMTIRQRVWERLASDMKPQHINQIVSQIEFDELPTVFAKVMKSEMKGRAVVKIGS